MGFLLVYRLRLLALIIAAVAVLSVRVFVEAWAYQLVRRPNLEIDLGFSEGTAILPGSGLRWAIARRWQFPE